MLRPNLLIFYVEDIKKSTQFYEILFSLKPQSVFKHYVAFEFPQEMYFALWSTQAKDFHSQGSGQRMELSFMVKDRKEVERLYKKWKDELDIEIEQELKDAIFGPTFVALDPDGHRIRVCIPD